MKSRLHRIEIRNFKAFREFTLDLEGRHLLVYGANGAGKSSLYWALYTILQSARKTKTEVAKYFEPGGKENLLNIHEQAGATPKAGEIALTLRDTATKADSKFRISLSVHGTHKQPLIEKGDLASDFVTYRFFFGFSHFRNSDQYDLWPLFEKEILPFCVSTSAQVPLELWNRIRTGKANPTRARGAGGTRAYNRFKQNTDAFAAILPGIVNSISLAAQKFYDDHFSADDPAKIEIKLGVTVRPDFDIPKRLFTKPEIGFAIKIGPEVINRPQVHLNEAKLTQLALSVRFGASLVNLHESDLKLLVLDDLLVSLDMSNRMKVVEILLSETFAGYQKIILTHELGFFQEFRRTVGSNHESWLFRRLTGNAKGGPIIGDEKSPLERAQNFLTNDQLAECGNQLRQCVEENLTAFLEQAKRKQGLAHLIDREAFASLHQKLNEASSVLSLGSYKEFADVLQRSFTVDQLRELASADEVDPAKFVAATKEEKKAKGALIGKLYAARPQLHQCIIELLSDASRKRLNALKLLDEVRSIKDRILNPASHAGAAPLYKKEAEDAIKVIHSLDAALSAALNTL